MAIRHGTKKGETLNGTRHDDRLFGEGGDDTINGKRGSDKIVGGTGNDGLFGGSGHDKFVFKPHSGKDFIHDFKAGTDELRISHLFGFHSVQDIIDAAHSSGGDTAIDLSGVGDDNKQIILLGIDDISQIANDIILI